MHLGLSYPYLILPLFPLATIIYSLAYIQYSWITITYHIKPHIYVGRLWKHRHVFIFCLLMFIKHTDKEADKTILAIKIGNAVQQMRYLTRALICIYIYIYLVIFQYFFHSTIENFICKNNSKSKKFICGSLNLLHWQFIRFHFLS